MNSTIPEFTTSIIDDGFSPQDTETKQLYKEVAAFAKQGQPIVIFGPTGAGKEFLARHYYKNLIESEFYQQLKDNWSEKYSEIKNYYSKFYSGQSLNIFLKSIKAGIFQSINSATIYPNLAESILFGHEANSFTGASTSPGLLESIKYGVLFMDEIGELSKNLQAKMLRAMDSEISEGRRIAGAINYSLKDIIIITATNRPRDKFRDDFYFKMGIEVEIKGIDERPNDVQKAIPYFIRKAIGKRKDYAAVIHMFGIKGLRKIGQLSETVEVKNFADINSEFVSKEVLKRKWPGNFRALRVAIEAAIFRIEVTNDVPSFTREFKQNLGIYITKYSESISNNYRYVKDTSHDVVFPSKFPEMDMQIRELINKNKLFDDESDIEKEILSVFLSIKHKTGFKRKDLEEYYQKNTSIKHTSEARMRSKINKLLTIKIIEKQGQGKSTRYHIVKDVLNKNRAGNFNPPKINRNWSGREVEIKMLDNKLRIIHRIYIQSPPRYGKTVFIGLFCDSMKSQYNFYYYPLGEGGLKSMFEDILTQIKSEKTVLNPNDVFVDVINYIHPFLGKLFRSRDGTKPVLILDNIHYVSDLNDTRLIVEISKKWQEVILILAGDKMSNELLEHFHEFSLGHWSKQA